MVSRAKEVGPNRFRESAGRYYEEFEIGHVYEHRPGRTISEADNTWFTLLTMNQHPLHFDAVYGAATEFKRPLVNSALTLSIVTGMSVVSATFIADKPELEGSLLLMTVVVWVLIAAPELCIPMLLLAGTSAWVLRRVGRRHDVLTAPAGRAR